VTLSNDEADNCADSGFFFVNTGLNEKVLGTTLFKGKPCDTIGDGTISNLTCNKDYDGINLWRTNEHGDTPNTATTTLQNCTVSKFTHFGVQIYSQSYTTVSGCTFTPKSFKGGHGIDCGGTAGNSADNTFTNDTVTNAYIGIQFSVFGKNEVNGGSYTCHQSFTSFAQGPTNS